MGTIKAFSNIFFQCHVPGTSTSDSNTPCQLPVLWSVSCVPVFREFPQFLILTTVPEAQYYVPIIQMRDPASPPPQSQRRGWPQALSPLSPDCFLCTQPRFPLPWVACRQGRVRRPVDIRSRSAAACPQLWPNRRAQASPSLVPCALRRTRLSEGGWSSWLQGCGLPQRTQVLLQPPHVTEAGSGAQRGNASCPRSHSVSGAGLWVAIPRLEQRNLPGNLPGPGEASAAPIAWHIDTQ